MQMLSVAETRLSFNLVASGLILLR